MDHHVHPVGVRPPDRAGDTAGAEDLDRGAREVAAGSAGYYGDAWLALSEGLADQRLAPCE
jgi:hypothetical protein